jgi:hypothetical protein
MQRIHLLYLYVLCFITLYTPTTQDVSVLLRDKICKASQFDITPHTYPYNSIHLYMADRDVNVDMKTLGFYTMLLTKWKVKSYTPFLNEVWYFIVFLALGCLVIFSNVFIIYI